MSRTGTGRPGWKQDPEGVRKSILDAAMAEFSRAGFAAARIDDIVARTSTSKRMVYYYFGDKAELYRHAIEAAYAHLREAEAALDLVSVPPREALERLVRFTFDYYGAHPELVRMVMIENVHRAEHLVGSTQIRDLAEGTIAQISDLIGRGQQAGDFRDGIDPVELHWLMSAPCFYNIANRQTFSSLHGDRLFTAAGQDSLRERTVAMILGDVCQPD